ncbi:MAG: hypothetical protein IPH04_20580 [Saprospirales bacterium]|nr:hypothetical protein [Saprospirales bacterium]
MKLHEHGFNSPWRLLVIGATLLASGLPGSPLRAQCDPPLQWGMSCNDWIQVSLPSNCTEEILPDLILEGALFPNAVYEVEIFHGINSLGNTAHSGLIGLTLTVQVTNLCTGENCWGNLAVSDHWAPSFDCPQNPVVLFCGQDAGLVPPPPLNDNCDTNLTPILFGEATESFGCGAVDGIWERIIRHWGGEDASGNEASPCQQEIIIVRGTLEEVVFPPDRDGEEAPVIDCGNPDIDPANTGYPTLNGQIMNGEQCAFSAFYSDLLIPDCASTQKILRTWTIWDGCLPAIPGQNPLSHSQIIWVSDLAPPTIQCPGEITVYLQTLACEGPVELPALEAEDNCSGYTLSVQTPAGNLETNGGIIEGLLPGLHPISYTATDGCGNQSLCEVSLLVSDGVSPVVICDETTVVSLDADGQAELPAADPDDGSYDGCSEVSFLIRRMDDPSDFASFAAFDCEDVNEGPVTVQVQVSDLYGNVGYCMVQVIVQDKIAPFLECPPSVSLECNQDPTDLSLTGAPEVWDACTFLLGWTDMGLSPNVCGWGELIRTFQAVDKPGNVTICQQTITILSNSPFGEEDIIWPEDYAYSDCTGPEYFHPDSLPAQSAWPVFGDHPCALVATNYEDAYFDIATPACFKILRTWRVIDWCQFDVANPDAGGYWEHEQILKVSDQTPPAMVCNFNSFVKVLSPDCLETINLPYPGITDCSPEVEITVESPFGQGFGPFPGVPLGEYPVTYTATDQCGNFSYCSFVLQVVDAKKPTPYCENGIVVELMQTGMLEIPASIIDAGSFDNCTEQEDLIISFSPNPADTIIKVDCSTPAGLVIEMWVIDEAGNADFCQTIILIQDNMNACPGVPVVAGTVTTEEGLGISEVWMKLNGIADPPTFTDLAGAFSFFDLETGSDYTMTAEKDLDPLNGVTTFDMVLIARHILGTQLLDSPYKIIAADVNRSNSVSTLDLVELRKVILLYENSFPNNTSWRFIDAAHVFPDPFHPFQAPFPEAIHYNDLIAGLPPPSFIAVKTGDVNLSATGY